MVWLVLASQVTLADPSPIRLELEEAIHVALVRSPRLQKVLARLKIAREQVDVVAAPSRLAINFRGGFSRVQPAQTPGVPASISGIEGEFQTDPNFAFNLIEGTFTIRQLIYDGGLIAHRIAAAKLDAQSTEYYALAEWRRLHLEIESAYISVLRSQERILNAQASQELAQANLTTAEKRFAVGQVPRGDIVFAQLPLAQAELEVQQAAYAKQSAEEQLLQLLGLPQGTPLEVVDRPISRPLESSLEEALGSAFEQRYELKAALAEADSAARRIRAAKKEDDPRVALGGSVEPLGFDGTQLAAGGYRVGVQLEWPILNGNVVRHQIRQAEAEHSFRLAVVEERKQEVEREVREAFRAVELAKIARDSTFLQVESAREALRISQGQYNAGLTGFPVVNEHQRELVRAQGAQTQATYDYLLARARLDQAMGGDVVEELSVTSKGV